MQMVTVLKYFNLFLSFRKPAGRWWRGIIIFILLGNSEVRNFNHGHQNR